ncbi:hypothetical protein PsorP6_015384 [Peronosclerospora sorghi]|uniref:Uncharacterized protein n=1 Tax=Peronosclerospora sorghi TaxID=230839 RepID=A0ACC0WQK3_9STRA|nr:hypothetical protein PsorP6_015384 [Peronosclerospora sorghi]
MDKKIYIVNCNAVTLDKLPRLISENPAGNLACRSEDINLTFLLVIFPKRAHGYAHPTTIQ